MYSNHSITRRTIHGLSCEVRIYVSPSHATLSAEGSVRHSVLGNVVLCDLPQLLLVNEVKLDSIDLPPGLVHAQVMALANKIVDADDLVERAGYTLQMLQNIYADHLGVPALGIRDRISI